MPVSPLPTAAAAPETQSGKPLVLILCTGNSCRSQMAEGLLRAVAGDLFEVASAGAKPASLVHPIAIRVMRELGIDISRGKPKHMDTFLQRRVHTVITVCDKANEACPLFPGISSKLFWPFEDPVHAKGTEAERTTEFRRVRDELKRVLTAYAAGWRAGSTHRS